MAVSSLSEIGSVTAVQPTPVFISPAPVVSERSFDDFMKGMLKTAHSADEQQKAQGKTPNQKQVFSSGGGREKAASTDRRSASSEPRRERIEAKQKQSVSDVSEKTEKPVRNTKNEAAPSNETAAMADVDIATDGLPEQNGSAVVEAEVETQVVVCEAAVTEAPVEGMDGEPIRLESTVQPIQGSVEPVSEVSVAVVGEMKVESDEIKAPTDWEPPVTHETGQTETESAPHPSITSELPTASQARLETVKQPTAAVSIDEMIPVSDEEADDAVWITTREQALESETTASVPALPVSAKSVAPQGETGIETEASTGEAGKMESPDVEIENEIQRDQDTVTLSAEATKPVQTASLKENAEPKPEETKPADSKPVEPKLAEPRSMETKPAETNPAEDDRRTIRTSGEMPNATPVRSETQPVAKPVAQVAVAKPVVASDSAPESASVTGMPGLSEPAPVSPKRGTATLSMTDEAAEADDGLVEEGEPSSRMATAGETQTERDLAEDRSSIGQDGWARGTAGATAMPSRQTTSPSSFMDRLQGAQDMSSAPANPTASAPSAPASSSLANQLEKVERLQELVEQFDRHVLSLAGGKDKTLSITLEPKSLGKVVLNCRETGDRMAVEIVAENAGVRQLLQQQESSVRQLLEEHGYKMGAFDVRTQDRGGETSSFARRRGRNDENAETGRDVKWRGEVTGSSEVGLSPTHAPRAPGGIWVVA